jgi:2-methylisocitrate lyase-like PEP mutase family enzyme
VTLQAALEARTDPDTVIIARTDARAPLGIEEAISRGRAYAEAGADVIFVEAPESVEEVERIADEIDAPLLLNVVPGGRTPEIPAERLAELGFRIAIHPGVALGAVAQAAIGALSELASTSALATSSDPAGFFDLFGLTRWQQLGDRYAGYERSAP